MRLLLLLCFSGTVFVLVQGQDCVYQGCFCNGNSVSCDDKGLLNMPPLVGSAIITDVSLDYNSISSLPAGCFPANIQQLSMINNPLTTIEDSVFDASVNTLQSVGLSGANFTSIPAAFGRLRKLQYLYIYNSKISAWNTDVMKNLSVVLQSLRLDSCNIQSWPEWMKYFTRLTDLSFSDNSIAFIPDDGLDSVAKTLTNLNLQNNSLISVPKAISKLTALQNLYLEQNHIADVTWLPPNSKLTVLYINNNNIYDADQLSQSLRPYADSLQELNIMSNSLTSIPNLGYTKFISNLDFTRNKISDSISGTLPFNLFSVSLSYNMLSSMPTVLLSLGNTSGIALSSNSLTQIRDYEFPKWTGSIDFSNNFITELTDNSFPLNCSLQVLELNGNPLQKISENAFKTTPKLQFISLQSTMLTRLPLGLLSGLGLYSVDFTGSPNLVCTCQEMKLAPWIKSLNSYAITGNCGRTSIRDFFLKFGSDCPA